MSGPIKILFLTVVLTAAPQLQHAGKRYALSLPDELSESEGQRYLKEQKPKSHIEMTFNVSDARLDSALERLGPVNTERLYRTSKSTRSLSPMRTATRVNFREIR